MFVQSVKFIEAHHGNQRKVSIYGQEYTNTTYKLAKMNLAIRGISANLGEQAANTFTNDQHKDLKADYIMANPPFNQKEWRGDNELVDDPRWNGYEVPPTSNIDEETDELLKRSRIIENDIVFTIAGTLGKFALVDSSVLPANTNQAVAIIRTSKISPEMLYSYFIGEWQVEFYKKNTQQAVQRLLQILCKPPERCRIETTEQEVKLCQSTN